MGEYKRSLSEKEVLLTIDVMTIGVIPNSNVIDENDQKKVSEHVVMNVRRFFTGRGDLNRLERGALT